MAVERRVRQELDIEPMAYDSDAEDALPTRFRLVLNTVHERRDARSPIWLDDGDVTPARKRETLREELSPRALQDLIVKASDWLAYRGEG